MNFFVPLEITGERRVLLKPVIRYNVNIRDLMRKISSLES